MGVVEVPAAASDGLVKFEHTEFGMHIKVDLVVVIGLDLVC